MTQFSSKPPFNDDPTPWVGFHGKTYVVREDNVGELTIFNEKSMTLVSVTRDEVESGYNGWGRDTARAYIDEHPIKKPWHDAKPGELWVLDLKGSILPAEVYRLTEWRVFRPVDNPDRVYFDPTNSTIEDAHRIWPQD